MKHIIFTFISLCLVAPVSAQSITFEESEHDEHVLTPEEEAEFYQNMTLNSLLNLKAGRAGGFRFAQTTWNECAEEITGNYYGYNCAKSRGISVILKKFIDTHFYTCVDAGLAAQGGGVVNELHIVHAGILGDRNHSPKSNHAENRAIDVKSFEMKLTNGKTKKFVFEGNQDAKFFGAFRKCWGNIVKTYNGCPLYQNNASLTASIGKENADHQHHLHTSVPYCVNGKYSPLYYQK